jgi:hypothetical protein
MNLLADPLGLEPGTASTTVAFGVLDGSNFPGCSGQDATFTALMRVTPSTSLNQLGSFRYAGFSLAAAVALTAIFFAVWVFLYRHLRIVQTMQPYFLIVICTGILIMASSIAPLSIDDQIVSPEQCSVACMSFMWLLSLGFSIITSTLFSKLWRINRLFNVTLRRQVVRERDVLAPGVTIVSLNAIVLLVWTLVDPMQWTRRPVNGQPWNTFGRCRFGGTGSIVFFALDMLLNVVSLGLASYQAYKARNISDEFSESKNLGIALFSWLQLIVVGCPVLFLIKDDNPTARYFLEVALLFAICMSMLLIIFVPMFLEVREFKDQVRKSMQQSSERISSSILFGKRATSVLSPQTATGTSHRLSDFGIRQSALGRGNVYISGLSDADVSYGEPSNPEALDDSDNRDRRLEQPSALAFKVQLQRELELLETNVQDLMSEKHKLETILKELPDAFQDTSRTSAHSRAKMDPITEELHASKISLQERSTELHPVGNDDLEIEETGKVRAPLTLRSLGAGETSVLETQEQQETQIDQPAGGLNRFHRQWLHEEPRNVSDSTQIANHDEHVHDPRLGQLSAVEVCMSKELVGWGDNSFSSDQPTSSADGEECFQLDSQTTLSIDMA